MARSLIDEVEEARRLPAPSVCRAVRVAAGVTQGRLAEELGVHPVTVARWEAGSRLPQGDVRRRYLATIEALQQVTS